MLSKAIRRVVLVTRVNKRNISCNELSSTTINIVKSTAPVLAKTGYDITKTMYNKMLSENAELRFLFNASHQLEIKNEIAHQPRALACMMYNYAENIDNLKLLEKAIESVAQKHVSLFVLPEHYTIVGENLLWAIKKVLGEKATIPILQAWKEAYFHLAGIFIKRENEIRTNKALQIGGWEGWRSFIVARKVKESSVITSFYLKSKDGKPVLNYKPGQYTALKLCTEKVKACRNYTLSKAAGDNKYRISVRRQEPAEKGAPPGLVSNFLHDHINVNDEVLLGVPSGVFTFNHNHANDEKPIVLMSAGVGLTPIVAMLDFILKNNVKKSVTVIISNRNKDVEALHDWFVASEEKHSNLQVVFLYDDPLRLSSKTLNASKLDKLLPNKDCHYFFCGPQGYMKMVCEQLLKWKIPEDQINYEYFGPTRPL
ncbi:flavohemoprotein-like isoform X2 [Zophobas morio]|uniref:flavohemoprotein-like isoform X2 n=1 Tax=Zophobas morio TaxID=2755281 RepID=UPI003083A996